MCSKIRHIRSRIEAAALRSDRTPEDVVLVAVSKYQPLEAMIAALDCGITVFGENRVQEMEEKIAAWRREKPIWHMIGHLQRNKVRKALDLFDCIESVDSIELSAAIERVLRERSEAGSPARNPYPVLVEVNTSGEVSKHGVSPDATLGLVSYIVGECPHVAIGGLMTVGPLSESERDIRASFALLRSLRERARKETGLPMTHLSMGMSGDFEMAIEEGGTLVRIGSGIFGARAPMNIKSD